MGNRINIGGRIHSTEVGNVALGANEVLDDTKGKKQNVINAETDAELLRLESEKQDNLTFDNTPTEDSVNPVTSGGVYAADAQLQAAIEAILLLIPSAASALNQLADMQFVNSSIATNTATFRGTYNSVVDLHLVVDATHAQIEAALDGLIAVADNNDYCYVQIPVSSTSFDIEKTERYKFNGTNWLFEYQLNNSGFTAAQWNAINSGITAALVGDINLIKSLIPSEATTLNQLADKAYVVAQIIAAIPAFKGQFETLAELQAVISPKAGDLGIVRTKDSDGYDVFTFYQYLNNQWNVFYTLSHHHIKKPASTGTTGDYPYNGMGRVVIPKNMVNIAEQGDPENIVNLLTQDAFEDGDGNPLTNTVFVIQYDFVLGEDITIPANCVLEFDGGSISNGTITPNNTYIKSNSKCFSNITIDTNGNLLNEYVPVTWVSLTAYSDIQKLIDYVAAKSLILDLCEQEIAINGTSFRIDRGVNSFPIEMVIRNGRFLMWTSGLFYSTLESSSYPLSERIRFENIQFITRQSITTELYVFDTFRFLRITFQNCLFNNIGAINSSNFVQEFRFVDCIIQPLHITFMKSVGPMYYVEFNNTRIESDNTDTNGIVVDCGAEMSGCSFVQCLCESVKHFIKYRASRGMAVTDCYFEGLYDSVIKQEYGCYDSGEGVSVTGCYFSMDDNAVAGDDGYFYIMDFITLHDEMINANRYETDKAFIIPVRERGKNDLLLYFTKDYGLDRTIKISNSDKPSLTVKSHGSGTFKCYPEGSPTPTEYTDFNIPANGGAYIIEGSNDTFVVSVSDKKNIPYLINNNGYPKSWKINAAKLSSEVKYIDFQNVPAKGVLSGTFSEITYLQFLNSGAYGLIDVSIFDLGNINMSNLISVIKETADSARGSIVNLSNGKITNINFNNCPLVIGEVNDLADAEIAKGRTSGTLAITSVGCGITNDGTTLNGTVTITFSGGSYSKN